MRRRQKRLRKLRKNPIPGKQLFTFSEPSSGPSGPTLPLALCGAVGASTGFESQLPYGLLRNSPYLEGLIPYGVSLRRTEGLNTIHGKKKQATQS
jgi:hypothetical protein